MVGVGFAPMGSPLLPWENCIERGHTYTQTFQLLDRIGPVGRISENPAHGRHRISQPMQIVAPIFFSAGVNKGADNVTVTVIFTLTVKLLIS